MDYEFNKEIIFAITHVTETDILMLQNNNSRNNDSNMAGLTVTEISHSSERIAFRLGIDYNTIQDLNYNQHNLSASFANLIDTAVRNKCNTILLDSRSASYDWLRSYTWDR